MSKNKSVIEMEWFSFQYEGGSIDSLHNISLNIRQGEFTVLTGASGCGKTTLTRCFNGLIPDFYEGVMSGRCTVHGMDIKEHETGDYAVSVAACFKTRAASSSHSM